MSRLVMGLLACLAGSLLFSGCGGSGEGVSYRPPKVAIRTPAQDDAIAVAPTPLDFPPGWKEDPIGRTQTPAELFRPLCDASRLDFSGVTLIGASGSLNFRATATSLQAVKAAVGVFLSDAQAESVFESVKAEYRDCLVAGRVEDGWRRESVSELSDLKLRGADVVGLRTRMVKGDKTNFILKDYVSVRAGSTVVELFVRGRPSRLSPATLQRLLDRIGRYT